MQTDEFLQGTTGIADTSLPRNLEGNTHECRLETSGSEISQPRSSSGVNTTMLRRRLKRARLEAKCGV